MRRRLFAIAKRLPGARQRFDQRSRSNEYRHWTDWPAIATTAFSVRCAAACVPHHLSRGGRGGDARRVRAAAFPRHQVDWWWAAIMGVDCSPGAPIVDPTTGLTDGGGPDSDVRNELACGLCAICGLVLELTAEEVDDALVSADAAAPSALLLRDALTLLLNCSAHALPAPAELAAEAWICLLEALPQCIPSHPDARWRNELFTIVVQRTATRCSRTHLTTSGSGEDLDDLVEWRERCGAPLLSACSETLGVLLSRTVGAGAVKGALHSEQPRRDRGASIRVCVRKRRRAERSARALEFGRCGGCACGGAAGGEGGGGGDDGTPKRARERRRRASDGMPSSD